MELIIGQFARSSSRREWDGERGMGGGNGRFFWLATSFTLTEYMIIWGMIHVIINPLQQYLKKYLLDRMNQIDNRAGSLNHFSGEPDRGEPNFSQSQRGIS